MSKTWTRGERPKDHSDREAAVARMQKAAHQHVGARCAQLERWARGTGPGRVQDEEVKR